LKNQPCVATRASPQSHTARDFDHVVAVGSPPAITRISVAAALANPFSADCLAQSISRAALALLRCIEPVASQQQRSFLMDSSEQQWNETKKPEPRNH
jgi:hypothetical protein